MINQCKNVFKKSLNAFGYHIVKASAPDQALDLDEVFCRIYDACKPYTMTTKQRMYALYQSVRYVIDSNVPGDFVECGVWKGGSSMLIAYTLLELHVTDRRIRLYDTFEGMSQPTADDFRGIGQPADVMQQWKREQAGEHNEWCYASLSEVRENMLRTGYPENQVILVKGKVEDTLPEQSPSDISLLRLDTDWYESTKHELIHLYPLVSLRGVLIIDDYGAWAGSRKAVDEYFPTAKILLHRIDAAGRIGIKVSNEQ